MTSFESRQQPSLESVSTLQGFAKGFGKGCDTCRNGGVPKLYVICFMIAMLSVF